MKLDVRPPGPDEPSALRLEAMRMGDVPAVIAIEQASFPTQWPTDAFYTELQTNKLAHYYVARLGDRVVGYAGIWVIMDDAHVTTLAVLPQLRGRRYGEILLLRLIDEAVTRAASWLTLEVRESNVAAQQLYRKYGFTTVAIRKQYYTDNNENALVMWAGNLKGELFRNRIETLRTKLHP